MSGGRGGLRLTASRRVEDDPWSGKGEYDRQQGFRMTAGRAGVNMTGSRKGRG